MLVNRHRKTLFRFFLADNVLVEKSFISWGFGRLVRAVELSARSSSLMISLQMSMHSLQTYTPGPAISFLTSFCDLPQNEQQRSSSGRRKFGIKQLLVPVFDNLVDQSVFLCLRR
jgi:hypothetical protein